VAYDERGERMACLTDVLVLDLADERGSFCSKLLADLGARVVKIEQPGGDPARRSSPLSFAYHNASKESITFDPDDRKGRTVLRRLVKKADVLVETLTPKRLRQFGLNVALLTRTNPGLIHVSLSGFGRTGRMGRYPWDNAVVSAYGGQMYVSGVLAGPPVKPPDKQSHYSTSLFGAVAILLALRERSRTGRGRYIDLSAQESVASTLDHVMVDYFHGKAITGRRGNVYGDNAFAILPCRDGFIQLTILRNWETLLELMAAEGLAEDLLGEKWQHESYRDAHFDHIMKVVGKWTNAHEKGELFELGQALRFPWAPMYSPEEVLKSPQLTSRRFFLQTRIDGRVASLPGLPYRFHSFEAGTPDRRPLPDQDNTRVFTESGTRERIVPESVPPGGAQFDTGEDRPALHGTRIIDFTWMLAGPYATRILADAGAEVIKVQSRKTARGGEDNSTGYFATWNRNKRSITLDLDRPEARDIILRLAAKSDVVMESFSPRIMESWGLTYSRLNQANPNLIMASISVMGQTGPWRDYVGFGPTFHALSGLTHQMSLGSETPLCLGHAYGDTILGLYGTLAVLAALRRRDTTGQGTYIDLSGYEAMCSVIVPDFLDAATEGGFSDNCPKNVSPVPLQSQEPSGGFALFEGCYRCMGDDRWCVFTLSNAGEWRAMCGIMDLPPITPKSTAGLDDLIGRWMMSRSAEGVVRVLQQRGIPAGVVQSAADMARDTQLARRRFFVPLQHPTLGTVTSDRTPLFYDRPEPANWRAAPLLGADNRYVFGELLGLSEEKIRSYSEQGIIG
jgi:crotonobetainyl-CoA:carnitine CoA-transferase CaiB-like acyl-CoA transferase